MKKPIEKRLIQKYMVKDDFVSRGSEIALRKSKSVLWLVLGIVLFYGALKITDNSVLEYILCGIAFVGMMIWYTWIYKQGKKFWNENKDKQEPIMLERLPGLFGKKRTWDE
jgi:hypothetical protein